MGDGEAHIADATSFVPRNQYISGSFGTVDLSDQPGEIDEQLSPGLPIGMGGQVGQKEWSTVV